MWVVVVVVGVEEAAAVAVASWVVPARECDGLDCVAGDGGLAVVLESRVSRRLVGMRLHRRRACMLVEVVVSLLGHGVR